MKKGLGSIPKGLAWISSKKSSSKTKAEPAVKKELLEKVEPLKTSQKGLVQGWTRATFIIKQEHCQKVKALAYWDRKTVKDVIEEALQQYLKNKKVKMIPR